MLDTMIQPEVLVFQSTQSRQWRPVIARYNFGKLCDVCSLPQEFERSTFEWSSNISSISSHIYLRNLSYFYLILSNLSIILSSRDLVVIQSKFICYTESAMNESYSVRNKVQLQDISGWVFTAIPVPVLAVNHHCGIRSS